MSEERRQLIEGAIEDNVKAIDNWIDSIAFNIKWNITSKVADTALGSSFKWAIDWIWSLGDE